MLSSLSHVPAIMAGGGNGGGGSSSSSVNPGHKLEIVANLNAAGLNSCGLSLSLDKLLSVAQWTGELTLQGRNLKRFPKVKGDKYYLRDTVSAGRKRFLFSFALMIHAALLSWLVQMWTSISIDCAKFSIIPGMRKTVLY